MGKELIMEVKFMITSIIYLKSETIFVLFLRFLLQLTVIKQTFNKRFKFKNEIMEQVSFNIITANGRKVSYMRWRN